MIETIAAVIGGGLAVTAFFISKRKTKHSDVFTIKSDGPSVVEANIPGQGYQPTPNKRPPPPQRPQSPSDAPTSVPNIESAVQKSMETLDMSNVTGIRLQGTGDVHLNNGKLFVDDTASVYVKRETLWIESKGSSIRISGNIFGSNTQYSNVKMVEVPTKNMDSAKIQRCSLNGSGDMKLSNMKIDKSLDVIVQGSGDIVLDNISTGTLELTVKGSGDISVNKKCRATHTLASVKGSGDITIKSTNVGAVAKKIKGSGDINMPKNSAGGKSGKPTTTSEHVYTSSNTIYTTITTTYE